jgi:integrase
VLVAASGTGGHLIPAVHIVRALQAQSPGAVVEFIGAGKPLEEKRVLIEHLRHTFVTLASRIGRLVQPAGTGGIPDQIVSQLVGHHDVKTTRTFYLAVDVPPLIVLPIRL